MTNKLAFATLTEIYDGTYYSGTYYSGTDYYHASYD